ncbi:MAG TPA: serine hydrolase domain-containing protein [Acetobacteraceae bacterium]|jgi:CubicO group peptidase (beta-lactamase class C family)|nr:serine hydrolase domain-containing protein [Acetobacteraceae bacterium]
MTDTPPWLAPALAYIPQWLDYQMRVTGQPGCVIAVAYRGTIVLEHALGHADLGAGVALTPRHRFRVASHSKSFTAAAMMKLREQGRVKLDDTAGQYVDGLHSEIATATIAQLLSHTAGIFRDGTDCAYWAGRAPFADEARIRADLALPPAIGANTRLKYSNHGFALAGLVIERITGEPYNAWVHREIVAPAGLGETTPDVPVPDGAPSARGHSGKALAGARFVFPGDQSTHALAAATGFVSTAGDLAKFFGQLAPNAATSILSTASRREMSRPQWPDGYSLIERSYGLGTISGSLDGWDWFGHSGGFQGYITRSAVVPEKEISVSVLTNALDGLSHQFLDGALEIFKAYEAAGAPSPRVADWTGRWWGAWGAFDLLPMGERVLVASPGLLNPVGKVEELEVTGSDEARVAQGGAFGSYGEPVRRERDAGGAVVALRLAGTKLVPHDALEAELRARYGEPVA